MKDFDPQDFVVKPGRVVKLAEVDPAATGAYTAKDEAAHRLSADIERLADLQDRLYAGAQHALLIVLQGMDSAGKDGVIKHVMTGVNPQGVEVTSFKEPSAEELAHDYLWRCARVLPARGRIGIFNRSYYEELTVVRVHEALLDAEMASANSGTDRWSERYEDITGFERHLTRNGTRIVKVFLHLSKDEQRKRLLARTETPHKNWKLAASDVSERQYWNQYRHAYEALLTHTSIPSAPWYIVPADHKWFTRVAVAGIIVAELAALHPAYPATNAQARANMDQIRKALRDG